MSDYDRQFPYRDLQHTYFEYSSKYSMRYAWIESEVWENQILKLTARKGFVFSHIRFSSYGLPIKNERDTWVINPEAHSTKSEEVIKANFIGKNCGEIKASNDVFGDPKPGVRKKLVVVLSEIPKEKYHFSTFTEADCNFCKEVAKDFDENCVETLKPIDDLMIELGISDYYLKYYWNYKQDATGKPVYDATEDELYEYLTKMFKVLHPYDKLTDDKIYRKQRTVHDIDTPDLIKNIIICSDRKMLGAIGFGGEKLGILERQRRKFLEVWVIKMATKWFYSNMDYFNKDFDHNEKWIPFQRNIIEVFDSFDDLIKRNRQGLLKMNLLMIWWILRMKQYKIIKLWQSMCISIEKTLINNLCFGLQSILGTNWLAYRLQYGGHDHGTIDWKADAFNISYLKNLVELSRKHIESIIENHKILFGIETTNLSITHIEISLWKHDRLLSMRLDDHIKNYRALTTSFEEMKVANSALQRKVETQDELIKGLTEKLDNLVKFFYGFKEKAPKEMIRMLLGTIEPLERISN